MTTEQGGGTPVSASPLPFAEGYATPTTLDAAGIDKVAADFAAAAKRSREAGFRVIEVHAAHGYLRHQFLSPISNQRTDDYGGSLVNRARLLREVIAAVRGEWPSPMPLIVRLFATDWVSGGWDADDTVALSRLLKDDGVDLIDCSSGGSVPSADIPVAPGYQVSFAARVRKEAGMTTGAVGLITTATQADSIRRDGDADLTLIASESLRDPYFPRRAAAELGVAIDAPPQYRRSW